MSYELEKSEYTITPAKPKDKKVEKKQEELETPAYMNQLDLSDDQKLRLQKELKKQFDGLKKAREAEGLDDFWTMLDNQYEGKLEDNTDQQFNLHKHTTKVKVDTIVRYMKKAFLESDPIFSIAPRPEYQKEGGRAVCEKQEDYLDYKLDEGDIPFKTPLSKVFHSGTLKGVGVAKITHKIKIEKRKREEFYKSNPQYFAQDPQGGEVEISKEDMEALAIRAPQTPIRLNNDGVTDFLQAYPDAQEKYPSYIKKLLAGKDVNIVVEYDDVTYNDPWIENVQLKDFYCRLECEGYEGLKTERLTVERQSYTWWELEKEERKGMFYDIDELKYEYREGKKTKEADEYETQTFDILECVYYFKLKEDDEEEIKIVAWMDEESHTIIGAINYPYYGLDCYYIPFNILQKRSGFYQPGIGEYLTDENIAEDALLNFTLEGLWTNNMITPITPEGSEASIQFMEKEWEHGMGINALPGEIDFLQKYMKPVDTGSLVTMMQYLTRTADDVTGVSSLITGQESSSDPSAPARKTAMLLQQSGLNISEYVETALISFNEIAKIILQITYQITREGRAYTPRVEGVVGEDPFVTITRGEMVARTNIQSQAMSFNLDKAVEKEQDLQLFSILRQEPLFFQNPEQVWALLKNIVKGWSKKWRNMSDIVLPPIQEMKKQQIEQSVQAVAQYMQIKESEFQMTGIPPKLDFREIMGQVAEASKLLATPMSKDEQKQREKQAKGGR